MAGRRRGRPRGSTTPVASGPARVAGRPSAVPLSRGTHTILTTLRPDDARCFQLDAASRSMSVTILARHVLETWVAEWRERQPRKRGPVVDLDVDRSDRTLYEER